MFLRGSGINEFATRNQPSSLSGISEFRRNQPVFRNLVLLLDILHICVYVMAILSLVYGHSGPNVTGFAPRAGLRLALHE
jgi:hypothetical protein